LTATKMPQNSLTRLTKQDTSLAIDSFSGGLSHWAWEARLFFSWM
jgi:hypothetical protein